MQGDGGTATQRLATVLLKRPLAEYIDEKRRGRPRWSWQDIADQLADDTDGAVTVSRETLRNWYSREAAA